MPNITHAGSPLYVDGVEYEVAPVTLEDLEYLDTWIRSRAIEAARMSLSEDASELEISQTLRAANETASKMSLFSGGGIEQLMHPLGLARFLMRLLKRKNPQVTTEMCFSWMMRKELRGALQQRMLDAFRRTTDPSSEGSHRSDPEEAPELNGNRSTKAPSSGNSSRQASRPSRSGKSR